eukprot:403356030
MNKVSQQSTSQSILEFDAEFIHQEEPLIDNEDRYRIDDQLDQSENSSSRGSQDARFSETTVRDRTESEIMELSQIEPRRFEMFKIYNKKRDKIKPFIDNRISTSKYNLFTFIPKNLFYQFSKMSNVYFLMMALLELIPAISDSGGAPIMLMPLSFVVFVSMIKDIFEDMKRHQSDNLENNRLVRAANPQTGEFDTILWKDLHVGMVVKIHCDEFFPADIALLNSSALKGICYIETKNLDGETNLKHKSANKETVQMATNDQEAIKCMKNARVECENPNEMLYKFEGTLICQQTYIPLSVDQILLRGSSLRNTEYVYGVVIFTGHETKIMKNSAKSKAKFSKLERSTNNYILVIVLMQFIMSFIGAIANTIWEIIYKENFTYILSTDQVTRSFMLNLVILWGTWFLSFVNIVPISLIVTLEMVKFIQAAFIQWDVSIYDTQKDLCTKVQTSNLNEELGTVHYIFSDKTGTLTQNVMEFKRFSAGPKSYGKDCPTPSNKYLKEIQQRKISNVNFYDPSVEGDMIAGSPNYYYLQNFFEILAVCHTIIVEEKDGELVYNASSPDELALVNAAKYFDYTFVGRDEDNNITINIKGKVKKFKLLNLIEFTSTRKRMTVIVRGEDGKIKVMCKGADSIIIPRLHPSSNIIDKTIKYLDKYAKEGLRTLLVAEKEISQDFYEQWKAEYDNALVSPYNREEAINKVAEKIEQDFNLIGSTAIEDKLQEDVEDTIKFIKEAGIKIWVLTGDKIETAINIGFSCSLLNPEMETFIIDEKRTKDIMLQITQHRRDQKLTELVRQNSVIVSGDSLLKICKNSRVRDEFLELAQAAQVVLACRVSPKQKAEIVTMVRFKNKEMTTLSIGDGANDVNMISAAHVGIGISGLEGQQAARASDYAIGQFKFLKTLLFVHGREAYRRNSYLICYMFYKNIIFVFPLFWYGVCSVYSGVTFYDSYLYQLFNLFFTSNPIMYFALFDYEFTKHQFMTDPKHYQLGLKNQCFSRWVFWRWIFYGAWQGALVAFFCIYSMETINHNNGRTSELMVDGQFVYMGVVTLVNIKILSSANTQDFFSIFCLQAAFPDIYKLFGIVFTNTLCYVAIFFVGGACILVDNGLNLAQYEIKQLSELQERARKKKMEYMIKHDTAIQRRRVTTLNHRGFAFSQEAGHTPQITENLFKKIRNGITGNFKPRVVRNGSIFIDKDSQKPQLQSIDESIDEDYKAPDFDATIKETFSRESINHNYFDGTYDITKSINQ